MNAPSKVFTFLLCLTVFTFAAYADQNSPCEKKLSSASVHLEPAVPVDKHHYNMQNTNSNEHFSNGGRWTVTTNQASKSWTGRGAGVKADGTLNCSNGVCSAILQGKAVVNMPPGSHCDHYIAVTPNGSNAIDVTFIKNTSGTCTGGHLHDDPRIHGGSAHGKETD